MAYAFISATTLAPADRCDCCSDFAIARITLAVDDQWIEARACPRHLRIARAAPQFFLTYRGIREEGQ